MQESDYPLSKSAARSMHAIANLVFIVSFVFSAITLYVSSAMVEEALRIDYVFEWKFVALALLGVNCIFLIKDIAIKRMLKSNFYSPAIWFLSLLTSLALMILTVSAAVVFAD